MSESSPGTIVVVGAGIIGTYVALFLALRNRGDRIVVLDRQPFAYDNASCGNLGGFATSEVRPLATLYNLWRAIRWLPDPRAPLALRASYVPSLWPWMRVFLKSALSRQHFDHVIACQQALMQRAYETHLEGLEGTGLDGLIDTSGALCLYKSAAKLEKDWGSRWRLYREEGHDCRRLTTEELRVSLPDLSPNIRHAIHVPDIYFWKDPGELLRGLHEQIQLRGAEIRSGTVVGVERGSNRELAVRLANGDKLPCDKLVVAAGAWSKPLCRELGDNVPLDTERGYHAMLPEPGVRVDNLLLLVEDDFVATPMCGGLRLGGTVELAGLEAPPDYRRTALLASQIREYFPGINADGRSDWLGFRPSIPDGLPVMGKASQFDNVFYAFGHGHVGMTQSAVSGKLLAQLVCGERSELDVKPYSVMRFGGHS